MIHGSTVTHEVVGPRTLLMGKYILVLCSRKMKSTTMTLTLPFQPKPPLHRYSHSLRIITRLVMMAILTSIMVMITFANPPMVHQRFPHILMVKMVLLYGCRNPRAIVAREVRSPIQNWMLFDVAGFRQVAEAQSGSRSFASAIAAIVRHSPWRMARASLISKYKECSAQLCIQQFSRN